MPRVCVAGGRTEDGLEVVEGGGTSRCVDASVCEDELLNGFELSEEVAAWCGRGEGVEREGDTARLALAAVCIFTTTVSALLLTLPPSLTGGLAELVLALVADVADVTDVTDVAFVVADAVFVVVVVAAVGVVGVVAVAVFDVETEVA